MVPPRRCPYGHVEVRAIVWEGHNLHNNNGPVRNADQEVNMVLNSFDRYGFHVQYLRIPRNRDYRSNFTGYLQRQLHGIAQSTNQRGQAALVILYYQGHGGLSRDGQLVLSNGNGESMYWAEIANPAIDAPCDVLTILNCCHAGAAVRHRAPARANYENHIKQVMMAVPAHRSTGWGYAAGFAACLEQALRDHYTSWPSSFRGTPAHWTESINRILAMKNHASGPVSIRHLVPPPPNAGDRPIVVSPR